MTGFKGLLESRRFWTLLLDTLISIVVYFISKYQPGMMDDAKFLIIALQPVAVMLIAAFTIDNYQEMKLSIAELQIQAKQ